MFGNTNIDQFSVRRRRTQAAAQQIGPLTITLEAATVEFISPWAGFVWNRPAAVHVHDSRQVARIPIIDVTLRVTVALTAVALLSPLLGIALRRSSHETGTDKQKGVGDNG